MNDGLWLVVGGMLLVAIPLAVACMMKYLLKDI